MLLYPVLIWFAYISNAPWWVWVCLIIGAIIKFVDVFVKIYQAGRDSK